MRYLISYEFAGSGRRDDHATLEAFLRRRLRATKVMKRQWICEFDLKPAPWVYGVILTELAGLFGDDKLLVVSLPNHVRLEGTKCPAWAATGVSRLE